MTTRTLHPLIFCLSLLGNPLIHGQHPAGFDTAPYQFKKTLIGDSGGEGLGTAILDPEIYRHSGTSHGKLRLVKEDGESYREVPWIIAPTETPTPPPGEQQIPHRIESFEEKDDGSIELTVALIGNTPPPARLEILTPLRDFEKSVSVSSGSDGIVWAPLVSDVLVFDYERFLDFRHTSLSLPDSGASRFKVRISNATDQQRSLVKELSRTVSDASGLTISEAGTVQTRPFRIDEIRFFTAPSKKVAEAVGSTFELKITGQNVIPTDKTSELLVDGGGFPVREFVFTTSERNFRREVSVQIPDESNSDGWSSIHRGSIHRYHVGDFREERLFLRFEEARSARFRIIIQNQDSQPISISGITGIGDNYELLFLAEPEDRCLLFLGSPSETMGMPRFDTAAISAAKAGRVPRVRYAFGGLEDNPDYKQASVTDSRILESKNLVRGIIAAVVALLIVVLYRTLKHVEAVKEDE